MTMDDQPFEDVAPIKIIKKGDFLFPCWSSGGLAIINYKPL